jgi:hypothetical protein
MLGWQAPFSFEGKAGIDQQAGQSPRQFCERLGDLAITGMTLQRSRVACDVCRRARRDRDPVTSADSPVNPQVIKRVLKFSADRQTLTLRQGQLLTLQPGAPHAVGESASLLTLITEIHHPGEPLPRAEAFGSCSG